MIEKYSALRKYFLDNNPVLTCFLVMYPVFISYQSVKISMYITFALTIMLIFLKIINLLTFRFLSPVIAYNISILYVSTYISLIFMISNTLYPNQLEILVPISILLITSSLVTAKLEIFDTNKRVFFCLIDGLIFMAISLVYIFFVFIIKIFLPNIDSGNSPILAISISTIFLNIIRIRLDRRTNEK